MNGNDAAPSSVTARARRSQRVSAATTDNGDESDSEDDPSSLLPDRDLRRQPTAKELQSKINLKAIDDHWREAVAALLIAWGPIRAAMVDDLVAQIAKTTDPVALALLMPEVQGIDVLDQAMADAWTEGAKIAIGELAAQGHAVAMPDPKKTDVPAPPDADTQSHADTLSGIAKGDATASARAIGMSAADDASHRAGGTLTDEERALQVKRVLGKLKGQSDQIRLGGSLSHAAHMGRVAVFQSAPEGCTFLADELLDDNTCSECIAIDQTEFASLDDALAAYPAVGYVGCQGGDKCRGQLAILTPSPTTEGDD